MTEHYAHCKTATGKDVYKMFACKWENPTDPRVIALAMKQAKRGQWLFSVDGHITS